jgi:DNA-binding PadR family transcriptional regulator
LAGKARASNDLVALTVLAMLIQKPCHPYELQRLIREQHKDFAITPTRNLYHTVERLVRDGFIEAMETTREGKRPERTVYQITDDGREEFTMWLRELLLTPVPEAPVFMAAVSFIAGLPVEDALRTLQMRAVTLEGKVADLDTRLKALKTYLHRLLVLEVEYTRAQWQAELEWVRALVDDIQSGRLSWDVNTPDWNFGNHEP